MTESNRQGVFHAPEGLIAYRKPNGNLLNWGEVPGAAGYYVYARANEAADNDYARLSYKRLNAEPLKEPSYFDGIRNATYRVSALDSAGQESPLSHMVFPVAHEGLEVLGVQYFSSSGLLTRLPAEKVRVEITYINSTEETESGSVEVVFEGEKRCFPAALLCGGTLQSCPVVLGNVDGPFSVQVLNADGEPLSALFQFRPKGVQLYDTLFNRGIALCEPQREILYSSTRDGLRDGDPVCGGEALWNCFLTAIIQRESPQSPDFQVQFGGYSLFCSAGGEVSLFYRDSLKAIAHFPVDCMGNAVTLQLFGENDALKLFLEGSHEAAFQVNVGGQGGGALSYYIAGWNVTEITVESLRASFAGVLSFGCENPEPSWNVACWHTHYNWIRKGVVNAVQTLADGSMLVANPARSLCRSPDGSEVEIAVNGSVEYEHTRRGDEGWPHLLLEVLWEHNPHSPERYRVEAMRSLWVTMDMRMLCCENKTTGYDPNIHAGQYVVYFNLRGANNESLWLGLCNMDSRWPGDENRWEEVFQMDPGTNTFIYAMPLYRFLSGHLADGQQHTMSVDLKPIVQQAVGFAQAHNAFQSSSFSDIYLNSMNLGFEIPGTFDMAFRLGNLQLAADFEA